MFLRPIRLKRAKKPPAKLSPAPLESSKRSLERGMAATLKEDPLEATAIGFEESVIMTTLCLDGLIFSKLETARAIFSLSCSTTSS